MVTKLKRNNLRLRSFFEIEMPHEVKTTIIPLYTYRLTQYKKMLFMYIHYSVIFNENLTILEYHQEIFLELLKISI